MKVLFIILLVLIIYCLVLFGLFMLPQGPKAAKAAKAAKASGGSCSIKSCKFMDPVSDPKYNMQQIVKQSILLEEHLANKNKRCRDCITKHFLHIIGLAEEAQMLATDKIDQYPLINECVALYNKLFKDWLKDTANENIILHLCDELRTMRKKLIALYFFDDEHALEL